MKINRIDLVFKVVDRIYITFEVYEELSKCKELVKSLIEAMKRYPIDLIESEDYSKLRERYPELGRGELSVIASAKGKIAFIEDRKAEKIAEEEGVMVFNIPVLLLVLKEKGLIDRSEIAQIIDDLKAKDGYLFKKEIKDELLR